MCGRFTITLEAIALQQELNLNEVPADWRPRYNVAPTQPVAVVKDAVERKVEWMKWGLVPSWASDPSIGSRMINARSETLAEKPSFRKAYVQRRCLILADGFYEWQKAPGGKGPSQPYFFRLRDGRPFAFAGLWEFWKGEKEGELRSCTIITTHANPVVAPVHERMPVMLQGDAMWQWLTGKPGPELEGLMKPFPQDRMMGFPVSRLVNKTELDEAAMIQQASSFQNY